MELIPPLAKLYRQLQTVPYLASKQLYRVIDHFLTADKTTVDQLCKTLQEIKDTVTACPVCGMWQEKNRGCSLCNSPHRASSVICVVETWQELMALDRTGGYNGLFHVLGGAISPLEGKNVEDLRIAQLIERITPEVKELILATNQTPEGEATAAYIAKQLKRFDNLQVSTLARGMPIGASLEFTDKLTLFRALADRRPF